MTFREWESLPEEDRQEACQMLDPYENRELFQGVQAAFVEIFGDYPGVEKIRCGLGPFIGPYNSIVVSSSGKRDETVFPDVFLGFPVLVEGG